MKTAEGRVGVGAGLQTRPEGLHFWRHGKDPGLDSAGGGVLWDVLSSHDMGRLEL